ncbi:hypothetical protein K3495_g4163 [Podosphaera aphanis]|nr:hypothetical protein K3495_g4163 [Podosphaera aphanis]
MANFFRGRKPKIDRESSEAGAIVRTNFKQSGIFVRRPTANLFKKARGLGPPLYISRLRRLALKMANQCGESTSTIGNSYNKTMKNAHPLSDAQDEAPKAAWHECYAFLDLENGLWQASMQKDSREKTAFVTPFEIYKWLVMPFGLCNAPAKF